jgi:hypothetical protein
MKPRYNIYQLAVQWFGREAEEKHLLNFLHSCKTLEEAEQWLKENGERWTKYSILPEYYWTGYEDAPSIQG